jgi:transposase InsO family protein
MRRRPTVLVELKLVEQRYRAVIDVLDGMSITDVARRNKVSRQTVHTWLRRYANGGMAALADKSSKPESCPHQMAPVIEARVVELRRAHPRWGPRSIRTHLAKEGFTPVPGRSSIYRTLVRHHLLEPTQRKRSRSDYKRWERSRSMELWQMDVVGRFHLADGTEVKVVTGVDDHSRFCVCARVVARATARPVCEALQWAMRTHGVPDQILTDNGKVFTARFGQGPGPVLFDRICANNGIRHLLTAPYSPTTTGKVERFHKTMREDFLVDNDRVHATIAALQSALDAWVAEYNTERPHQSLGDRPPLERFALASAHRAADLEMPDVPDEVALAERPPGVNRWVDQRGSIALGGLRYRVGPTFAGEPVEVVVRAGLVEILHAGVLVATHAERRRSDKGSQSQRAQRAGRSRPPTSGMTVTRRVDGGGTVSFSGTGYRVGRSWARQFVEVAIVAGSVQISSQGKVIRVHAIRHDRSKEHGAFATPKGRPRKNQVA